MRNLVASDIFGRTEALEQLCQQFTTDYQIVDPYAGRIRHFENEAAAYRCFMHECGIEAYSEHLEVALAEQSNSVNLLGFSVGASAIWEISERVSPQSVSNAVGFYGSQIRHSVSRQPAFRFELFLPSHEESFDIDIFRQALSGKANVKLHPTDYKHGFMNPHSRNFSPEALNRYLRWLSKWAA